MIAGATKESIGKNANMRETLHNWDQIREDIKTLQKKNKNTILRIKNNTPRDKIELNLIAKATRNKIKEWERIKRKNYSGYCGR